MKLRNKQTGEIGELQITEKHCAVSVGNGTASCGIEIYSSLAKLNEEWEDYKEPKGLWAVGEFGELYEVSGLALNRIEELKEIGNYFETEEEAEKACDKLKAWKRLKDNGFKFLDYTALGCGEIKFEHNVMDEIADIEQLEKDLNLLFGGEE